MHIVLYCSQVTQLKNKCKTGINHCMVINFYHWHNKSANSGWWHAMTSLHILLPSTNRHVHLHLAKRQSGEPGLQALIEWLTLPEGLLYYSDIDITSETIYVHASRTIQMCEDREVMLSHFPISSGCTMPLPRKVWNTFDLGCSSHVMATTLLAASKNPMSKQKQPSGNTMSRRSRRMVPCIHPALLVPLLLGAGAMLDKTISVPAACPTQIWYYLLLPGLVLACLGLSWTSQYIASMLTNHQKPTVEKWKNLRVAHGTSESKNKQDVNVLHPSAHVGPSWNWIYSLGAGAHATPVEACQFGYNFLVSSCLGSWARSCITHTTWGSHVESPNRRMSGNAMLHHNICQYRQHNAHGVWL